MNKNGNLHPAVFLDRDGVLIHDNDYLSRPEQVELIAGAVKSLLKLSRTGFKLVVVTNQSGVARGYFTENDVRNVHRHLNAILAGEGITLDGIYYSPYHPQGTVERYAKVSDCRKPAPGMLLQAASDLNIDLSSSYMIGDKHSDLAAAEAAGVKGLLVLTGYGKETLAKYPESRSFPTIHEAAEWIIRDAVEAGTIASE